MSFQALAEKKKKEQEKLLKKGFASKVSTSSRRAYGGSSPASNLAIERVQVLEETLTGTNGGPSLTDRLDSLETNVTNNGSSIDTVGMVATNLQSQINTINTEVDAVEAILPTKANINDIPTNLGLTAAQVEALVLQLLAEQEVVPVPDDMPTILSGQYGSNFSYTETWGDDFSSANAETLFNRWHPDLMTEGLHQAGNENRTNWRWSANYSQPEDTAFIKDDALHMRAKVVTTNNPFRQAYEWRGRTMNPQNYWIYLSFLTTWARVWDNTANQFITDPNAPNRTWGPGSAFEFKVDLSEMRTQACRLSFYLLPAYENDSYAYSPDGTRGVEIDVTEIDFLDGYEDYSQSKVISEYAAGNTPLGSIDLDTILADLNLPAGEHTFTFLWAKNKLVWYVNGIEIQRDEDPRRIPQVPHYVVISREANSGIKAKRNDGVLSDGVDAYSDGSPLMPRDTGIWAVPVYAEIDRLHNDTARVLSFQSYSFVDTSVAGYGVGDDSSGISPTITSLDPPTVWSPLTTHTFTFDWNGRTVSDWVFELGSTRGGNELDTQVGTGTQLVRSIQLGWPYSGPVNGRLWFRESANSVWHWRDFGFSSGLQAYHVGTGGNVGVTVPAGQYTPTPATVPNGTDTDGNYAASVDYTGGVVPVDYATGYTAPTIGVVGEVPPIYSGTVTLSDIPGSLTYDQYPNITGELCWASPADFNSSLEKFEVTINGVVVYRGIANCFFVEGYPPQGTANATVRVVKDNGEFGNALSLNFQIVEL